MRNKLSNVYANTIRTILAAGIALALAFMFSCSEVPSSSSLVLSSSSSIGHSGSYGSMYYEGQTYKTVVIGEQVWMAENLNRNPYTGNSACYDNQPNNCNEYGRLYDWSTAMNLPSSCNSTYCLSQIGSPHQGICPDGWHIPSGDDWVTLIKFAGGSSSTAAAGKHLKAKEGWNPYSGIENLDTYDFPPCREATTTRRVTVLAM